jgi:hypothetical protein
LLSPALATPGRELAEQPGIIHLADRRRPPRTA